MLSIGIIWNPVSDYFDDIVSDIKKKTNVYVVRKETVEDTHAFVYAIYQDMLALDRSKIVFKLQNLFLSIDNVIVVIIFDFDESNVYFHPYKHKNVYAELDSLKRDIRQKYGNKITNYQFDNVFHCTDDEEEFKYTYKILKKYFHDIPDIALFT